MLNTNFFEILLILCICFFQDIYAKYMFYLDTKSIITKKIPNTINPDWNFTQLHATPICTQEVCFYDSQPWLELYTATCHTQMYLWGKFFLILMTWLVCNCLVNNYIRAHWNHEMEDTESAERLVIWGECAISHHFLLQCSKDIV